MHYRFPVRIKSMTYLKPVALTPLHPPPSHRKLIYDRCHLIRVLSRLSPGIRMQRTVVDLQTPRLPFGLSSHYHPYLSMASFCPPLHRSIRIYIHITYRILKAIIGNCNRNNGIAVERDRERERAKSLFRKIYVKDNCLQRKYITF